MAFVTSLEEVQKVTVLTSQGLERTWHDLIPENQLFQLAVILILLNGPLFGIHVSHKGRERIVISAHSLRQIIKDDEKNVGITEKHHSIE